MIPAEFDYTAPDTLEEAIRALSEGGEDAKLLAGGHSLLPLMKLRLAAPTLLVDLRKVPGIDGIQREDGHWRIGAMTPHTALEHSPDLGLTSRAAATIADPQVRNRGTIGGSLAHGDPASDLPAVLLVCEGTVTLQGASGQRTVDAGDLFRDYMETAIGPDEVLTEVRLPAYDDWGFGYQKFNRRSEDWAMVAVSALVKQTGRYLRGRASRADEHGLGPVARIGRRGRPARAAAECRDDRQGIRAGRRGDGPTRRSERQLGLQASPGARAHQARVGAGCRADIMTT